MRYSVVWPRSTRNFHDHVAAVVQHVYARFNQSTLRDFIPLLVERRAREELAKVNGSVLNLRDDLDSAARSCPLSRQ